MLLTSSQVSIAASSSVVVVFTTALFLSGYVIQQRTLRDLREAIKPSPRAKPQIFLPDRFRATTTELEDGTVIIIDVDMGPDTYRPPRTGNEQVVVEVTPTVADEDELGREQQIRGDGARLDDAVEGWREGTHEQSSPSRERESISDGQKKQGKGKRQRKLSRAERRKQIKDELQRLGQGNKRGYYQPRLW